MRATSCACLSNCFESDPLSTKLCTNMRLLRNFAGTHLHPQQRSHTGRPLQHLQRHVMTEAVTQVENPTKVEVDKSVTS
jgi:hypothetical protein